MKLVAADEVEAIDFLFFPAVVVMTIESLVACGPGERDFLLRAVTPMVVLVVMSELLAFITVVGIVEETLSSGTRNMLDRRVALLRR